METNRKLIHTYGSSLFFVEENDIILDRNDLQTKLKLIIEISETIGSTAIETQ